jgi:hypothetical protein
VGQTLMAALDKCWINPVARELAPSPQFRRSPEALPR